MSSLGRFTGQLKQFVNVMLMLYPDDKYFKKASTLVDLGVQANPRMVHTLFMEHVMKYKDDIVSENEKFFLEFITDDEKRAKLASSEQAKQYDIQADVLDTVLQQCALYWKQLESEQKANIWKYLKVLIVLAERV